MKSVPLRARQLLSETFLSTEFSFRDLGLDHLKWDTSYNANPSYRLNLELDQFSRYRNPKISGARISPTRIKIYGSILVLCIQGVR